MSSGGSAAQTTYSLLFLGCMHWCAGGTVYIQTMSCCAVPKLIPQQFRLWIWTSKPGQKFSPDMVTRAVKLADRNEGWSESAGKNDSKHRRRSNRLIKKKKKRRKLMVEWVGLTHWSAIDMVHDSEGVEHKRNTWRINENYGGRGTIGWKWGLAVLYDTS